MPAEANLIKAADLARAREVEFVNMFRDGIKKLLEALGTTRKYPKQAGATLKSYVASGTLEDGKVAEGDLIPLSKYKTTAKTYKEITLQKWRKATSAEAIVDKGYDQAVQETTDAMLKDIQKGVRKNFFAFLKTGTAKTQGVGLQGAMAQAWGQLQVKYEDTSIDAVYFVNPLDVADYLEGATITTQTAFGMSYIENFLGMGTVFLNTDVTKGKVYATAKNNVVLYYIPVNGADLGEAFSFTSDQTGLIGIHEQPDYSRMTCEDIVTSGIELFAERLDGIVEATISPAAAA